VKGLYRRWRGYSKGGCKGAATVKIPRKFEWKSGKYTPPGGFFMMRCQREAEGFGDDPTEKKNTMED